jgi:hypothetical protein
MIKKIFAFVAITLVACLGAFANKAEGGFFDAAIKESADSKKHLLFLYTGSTWCPACQYFERKVLATDEWKTFANENVTFLVFDVAGRKIVNLTLNGKSIKGEGDKLATQFEEAERFVHTHNIRYLPTLMTYDHKTKKWRHINFELESTPASFIKTLKSEWSGISSK